MSRQKGDVAENSARVFLQEQNFEIVETNFYAKKLGEIDIVAKKDGVLYFCEVKSAENYEIAVSNLTNSKLQKIKRSVNYYLQTKKVDCAFCISAIIVTPNCIEILENITI